jgi:hypothetical protein
VTLPALPRFVRAAPRIFFALGVVDFIKNMIPVYVTYEQSLTGNAYPSLVVADTTPLLVQPVMAAIVYAAGWFAYGIFAIILLSIHGHLRGSQPGAASPVTEAAE